MKELLNIEIAGVRFALSGDSSVELHNLDPAYEPFLNTGICRTEDLTIDIRLETGKELPDTEGQERIFDSGQSWSLFRGDNCYSIVLAPPDCHQPLWLARFNRALTQGAVFCSDQLATEENHRRCFSNPVSYPLDQILLMHFLGRRNGLLVHAMGLGKEGRGYVFPGKSGAGKSTLAKHSAVEGNLQLLSDDRVVIRRIRGDFMVFGTPWPGDAGNVLNESYPLEGIFFIEQSRSNKRVDISGEKAIEKLFSVSSIPWYDRELVPEMLQFCEELISNVPVYELHCRPDIRVEDVLN